MKYQITVNEKQARIISNALDVCSRLQGGQFDTVLNRFSWKELDVEERNKIREMLTDLKCMLTGVERNAYLGIGQISDDGQIAYDIHQVVRHALAVNSDFSPTNWSNWTVDYNEPLQHGSEPLCHVKGIKEKKFKRSDGYSEESLLGLAVQNHFCARLLLTHPICFFSSGFLMHLSLELFLKACCLFKNSEFSPTHKLKELIREATLALDSMNMKFITEFDKLHYLRYKIDEVGTDIDRKFNSIVANTLLEMPEDFRSLWSNEKGKIKEMSESIPLRVFKDLSLYSSFIP